MVIYGNDSNNNTFSKANTNTLLDFTACFKAEAELRGLKISAKYFQTNVIPFMVFQISKLQNSYRQTKT